MELTTTVTERDKRLLLLLFSFLIVMFFGFCIIRPAVADIISLKEDLAIAQAEKEENDNKISQIPTGEAAVSALYHQITEQENPFYDIMTSPEIDNFFTSMALKAGFQKSDLRALTISEPEKGTYMTFDPYLALDAASQASGTTQQGIYCVDVGFTLYGEPKKLQSFLDDLVAQKESMRVVSYAWNSASGTQNLTDLLDAQQKSTQSLYISLAVYMTDPDEVTETITTEQYADELAELAKQKAEAAADSDKTSVNKTENEALGEVEGS